LNVVRNRVRGVRLTQVPLDGPVEDTLASNTRADHPEAAAVGAESLDRLGRAIKELPERYASAVVLRHVQGLSYVEAAEALGQPVGTTKSDVHRGLRMLRAALEPELQVLTVGEQYA